MIRTNRKLTLQKVTKAVLLVKCNDKEELKH